jgi:hypothetical protein
MQHLKKLSLLFFIMACVIATGCSSSKKGQCGCPNKQGMIGYK